MSGQRLKAISVRQPWAWLILHAGKDIENRTWFTTFTGPVLLHAASTMTKADYVNAMRFVDGFADIVELPAFDSPALWRGGIVGRMEIVRCVQRSESRWFMGPYGFVLANVQALPFEDCPGRLKFFTPEVVL